MMTENPLSMSTAAEAFGRMDTTRQAAILQREGCNYATDELVSHMRASAPESWAALVLKLDRTTQWAGEFSPDDIHRARELAGLAPREAVAA